VFVAAKVGRAEPPSTRHGRASRQRHSGRPSGMVRTIWWGRGLVCRVAEVAVGCQVRSPDLEQHPPCTTRFLASRRTRRQSQHPSAGMPC
jgi:hypothetical protein